MIDVTQLMEDVPVDDLIADKDDWEARALAAEAEVERLRPIAADAHWIYGPASCVDEDDDPDCGEYWDGLERRPDVKYCSHVVHLHATADDVRARWYLEHALGDVLTELVTTDPDVEYMRDALELAILAADKELDEHSPTSPRADIYSQVRAAHTAKVRASLEAVKTS